MHKLSNKALAKKLAASLERTNVAMQAIYDAHEDKNTPFLTIVEKLGQNDARVKKFNDVYAVRLELQNEAYSRLGPGMTTGHMITVLETTRRPRR